MDQHDDANEENSTTSSIKSVYKICIQTRNFEIEQLIQRNNFFMLFQGVLLAAALQNQASKPYVELIVSLIGIFVSYYQLQMSCGAKFWQEWWESRVEELEVKLKNSPDVKDHEFHDLFNTSASQVHERVSKRLSQNGGYSIINQLILNRFSVSRAPISVSLVLLFGWSALTLQTLKFTGAEAALNSIHMSVSGYYYPQNTSPKPSNQK